MLLPEAAAIGEDSPRVRIARRYLAGESAPDLAREAGVAESTIRRWVARERAQPGSVPTRGGARPGRPQRSAALQAQVMQLKERGWSPQEIARGTGKHPNTIRRYLTGS